MLTFEKQTIVLRVIYFPKVLDRTPAKTLSKKGRDVCVKQE